jgi:hypothetical protein
MFAKMKSIISISFAFLFFLGSLFPKNDMAELFKIPILLQHYQTNHSNLSFWNFLKLHYSQTNHHSDQDHENLPLQKNCPEFCHCFLVFIIPNYFNTLTLLKISFPNKFKISWLDNYSFLSETHLLQPPRTV